MLNKVPEVTIYFWIIKILCTTVGESFADYINETLGFALFGSSQFCARILFVEQFLKPMLHSARKPEARQITRHFDSKLDGVRHNLFLTSLEFTLL